jgi:hypothetical protein
MKILLSPILIGFVLSVGQTVLCQSKPIDKTDFNIAFTQSDPSGKYRSWRLTHEQNYVLQGKKKNVKATREFVSQNVWREAGTEVSDNTTKISEVIYLNGTYYCRTDGGPWKKASMNCSTGSGLGWLPPDYQDEGASSVEDTILDKTPAKLYKFRVVYKDSDGTELLYERNFWLNQAGQRLKAEAAIKVLATSEILENYSEIYEYNVAGLKIVAPIK